MLLTLHDGTDTTACAAAREELAGALEELASDRVDFCQVFCSVEFEHREVLSAIWEVIGSDPELIACLIRIAVTIYRCDRRTVRGRAGNDLQ